MLTGDDMDIDKLRNDAVNCEATHQQQVKQEGPEPPVPGGEYDGAVPCA